MLTKKHYTELAAVIAESTKGSGCRLSLEVALIDWLASNSPKFDRVKFRAAIAKFEKSA